MFKIFQRPGDQRIIDHGRVFCTQRGCDIDMDLCGGCRWLLEINDKADVPFVRCDAQRLFSCAPDVVRIN